jgi:hypothetical protein
MKIRKLLPRSQKAIPVRVWMNGLRAGFRSMAEIGIPR